MSGATAFTSGGDGLSPQLPRPRGSSACPLRTSSQLHGDWLLISTRKVKKRRRDTNLIYKSVYLQIFYLFLKYISVNKSIYTGIHGNSSQLFYRSYLQTTPQVFCAKLHRMGLLAENGLMSSYLHIHSKRVCFSCLHSTVHTRRPGLPENALQCVTEKALQSPEGKAIKHRQVN